jgi:hypothetical protein
MQNGEAERESSRTSNFASEVLCYTRHKDGASALA